MTDLVLVANLADQVVNEVSERNANLDQLHVETVQDIVEETLMKNGHYKVAKAYIIYRETHKKVRQEKTIEEIKGGKLSTFNFFNCFFLTNLFMSFPVDDIRFCHLIVTIFH